MIAKSPVIIAVLCLFFCSVYAQERAGRPNIIFIIADDVSDDDLGCYGNRNVRTPNIDRIAREGMRFTNFYLTTSSCSPSRTSILTGRYPHNTGAAELHTPLPVEQVPFPLLLKQAGYYSVQAGKSHFGEPALRAFDKAYEQAEGGKGAEGRWLKCLQERPKDRPIFAWFAAIDAHRPWDLTTATPEELRNIHVPPYLVDDDSTRRDLLSYYKEISRFDNYVGEVESELKRQGILDNTIIIIMADNGRPFPRCKTRLHDSGIRTPFIVKWNRQSMPGTVCSSLVSAVDIAPTLVELAGLRSAKTFQGKSFAALLKDPKQAFRKYVYAEHNWHDYEAHERMIRTVDFMYILNSRPALANQGPADSNTSPSFHALRAGRDQNTLTTLQQEIFMAPRLAEELYDCRTDSLQQQNLLTAPAHAQMLGTLRNALTSWRSATRDNTPKELTGDWFNRETGASLDAAKKVRGEMPGVKSGALDCISEMPLGF